MITSASFRNFKSLRHVDIELERLTVLVGPNASGKTSILEGLHFLALCASREPKDVFTGQWSPGLFYSRGTIGKDMEIESRTADAAFRLKAKPLEPLSVDGSHSDLPTTFFQPRWDLRVECQNPKETPGNWRSPFGDLWKDPIASLFRSAKLYRLEASVLAEPSYSGHARSEPKSNGNGEGLASELALMALNQPDRFQEVQELLRSVIPVVQRIRFNRVPVTKVETEVVTIDKESLKRHVNREYIGDELIIDFQGAPDVPARLASEGTILVVGLLAILMGAARPRLVLIDDLDHGLHPRVQRKIIPLLHTIVTRHEDLQIIATTHSPYIVDQLEPKEVRITWAGEDGATRCGRLDRHPDFERWKDEMWPGEFWSIVGEQWLADGEGREGQ
jgi:predicted ATPase